MDDENKEVNEQETKPEENTSNNKKMIYFAIGLTVLVLGLALAVRLGGEAAGALIVFFLIYGIIYYNRWKRRKKG